MPRKPKSHSESESHSPVLPPTAPAEVKPVDDHYSDWFLDYASYVILERAVPHVHDGMKPVQRRILHSLWELEDGRYNKVANGTQDSIGIGMGRWRKPRHNFDGNKS